MVLCISICFNVRTINVSLVWAHWICCLWFKDRMADIPLAYWINAWFLFWWCVLRIKPTVWHGILIDNGFYGEEIDGLLWTILSCVGIPIKSCPYSIWSCSSNTVKSSIRIDLPDHSQDTFRPHRILIATNVEYRALSIHHLSHSL